MALQQEGIDNQRVEPHVEHPSEFVLLSSGTLTWNGILLEHLKFPPLDISDFYAARHHLTLQLRMPKKVELKTNGKFNYQQLLPGNVCITPFQHLHAVRWQDEMEVLSLTLEPEFVAHAVQESVNPERVELMMHRGQKDPLIREILFALKAELEAGCPSGRLYGEAMGTALAVHLLKCYSTLKPSPTVYVDGLPQHKLNQVLEYIQVHLDQDIKLIDLADCVGMSQYYFCRLFKQSMGVSPHQFMLQQRIERAKQLLQQKDLTIADIALSCGFKNQSHFTTLFRKFIGSTPKAFRNL
ncbi:helix-turn-helix transcriptional regulator [Oscillatoria sp. FACHB-1407]|uniref:helix-turn-helix transcriptional regulator n=1 Tax=Oscillatoria sp. FACHB-1407 TaxID=2692847 RepID=UPI001689A069|nr:AraC family transcriptional regulator [Oscillatoria sp. FACHB-1407]MBD2465703.1 helix-turn-helix transcriptional regulator [Oscillatoria sp. FACHB-1407]